MPPPGTRRPERGSSGEEERALVRRMAAGDQDALGELYDRCSSLVYSIAHHVVGRDDDAEEVVEETFWQAWRQADRYEGGRASVSTWLGMMARSRALDRLRARNRLREEALDSVPERADGGEDAPSAQDPLEHAEAVERGALVRKALDQLPPEQRRVMEMTYFGGLSHSEIAASTGEPLGTVKARIRLAVQKLREKLAVLREGSR